MHRRAFFCFVLAAFTWLACPAALADDVAPTANDTVYKQPASMRHVALDQRGRLRLARGDNGYAAAGEFVSQPIAVDGGGHVRVDWIEQWTTPQRWKKHQGNPIYGPELTGKWDTWTNGVSIVRNPDDETYKMFYCGRAGAGIGFAEASINDPLTWKEHAASPVLKPLANWEGNRINQPRVVKVTDQHWRLYYTGWGYEHPNGGSRWAFNLAESFDGGVTWKRHGEGPLLERGAAASPDGGGVCVPEVRRVGNKWMMWYTAMKIASGQNIHLCLATSADGIQWKKYSGNPVLTENFAKGPKRNVISRCFVRYAAGLFQMWYSHGKPNYRIKYAESLDGIAWERSPIEPVLDVGPEGSWDSQMVEYPEVDVVDGRWRLWFCGNGFGSVGYAEGVPETAIRVEMRAGQTVAPDDSWSRWKSIRRGATIMGQTHLQLRVQLTSSNSRVSPALHALKVTSVCAERSSPP